ncbi:MAG TPA: glycine zipper family protein [Noviherbaspirillum sp.]|uniref:glycine zipper family protein n=1 Tax=Noviherbaspirillum sp. TaxID=1926288 RepID=UPI002D5D8115|nr:glycine zipper family protein [Noviherbaspirillum sp.]HYD94057.1 glycine zipper family protein [Noviherbaspirillum sp.]
MNELQQNFSGGLQGGFNPAQAYGQQLAPQGFFGSLLGAPLGGLAGKGIGSLFGNPNLGAQIGQIAGGIGGSILPFGLDPISQAYGQQQLAPQGWFGNLLSQVGQPLGSAIGGAFGQQGLGSAIGGAAGQLGRILPFGLDPISQAYAQQQQQQLAPQGFFGSLLGAPLGGLAGKGIGSLFGNPNLGAQIGQIAGGIGGSILPFGLDPISQAYAQQQLAPQGWFGNLLSQVGQPLGSAIGGAFGQQGLGSAIGGAAGQLGRILPFGLDPISQAYAQQQQLAPQGWFGNLLSQVGQPLGSAIGGAFGQQGLGSAIGNAAGQLGRMLPFYADPAALAYAQQQQAGYPGFQTSSQGGSTTGMAQPTIH